MIRTKQKPADILKYFAEVVVPMQRRYIETQKKNADIIITNEYDPYQEAGRVGLFEVQLKFKTVLNAEFLRMLGVERLGLLVEQTDIYYNPDRDLSCTGESLRIREEGNPNEPVKYMTLTYKGPQVPGSKFRERPKIEFEIDEPTKKAFLSIYGNRFKIIKKKRTLYILNGIVFSFDEVVKIENGVTYDLGNFIEIRTTRTGVTRPEIDIIMERLGLDINNGIKESYVEM